jgi:hypothetical protein
MRLHSATGDTHHNERLGYYARSNCEVGANVLSCALAVSDSGGETPSDVDVKICTDLDDVTMECIRYQEVWEVVVVTSTKTKPHTVQISTTGSGPGTLVVATATGIFTDTVESIDLPTVLLLETEIETESISIGRKPTATISSMSQVTTTVFITKHLHHKSTRYALFVPSRGVADFS